MLQSTESVVLMKLSTQPPKKIQYTSQSKFFLYTSHRTRSEIIGSSHLPRKTTLLADSFFIATSHNGGGGLPHGPQPLLQLLQACHLPAPRTA
jgi:hypothetical protein